MGVFHYYHCVQLKNDPFVPIKTSFRRIHYAETMLKVAQRIAGKYSGCRGGGRPQEPAGGGRGKRQGGREGRGGGTPVLAPRISFNKVTRLIT